MQRKRAAEAEALDQQGLPLAVLGETESMLEEVE
jgi:hypothetical protein